ncbi:MAG: tRNA (adenine(22)-N(1))-methyltransferase [Anaeroplasmataceae bacterium]
MDRLDVIASLTKGYKTLADIGSDHGYVCIEAIKKYGVEKAYACDINEGPLLNAMNNIKHYNLTNNIKTILSDGLKNFNDDVECITICGMGGVLIKRILTESLEKAFKAKTLILQPNNEEAVLREFLLNNGFSIKHEIIIKDKKHFYEILVCIPIKCDGYSKKDIDFGPCLRAEKSPIFIEKWTKKLDILKNNYDKASESKKKELNEKIKTIEEVL